MVDRAEKFGELKTLVADRISTILEGAYPGNVIDLKARDSHTEQISDLVTLYRAIEIAETTNKQGMYNLGNIV
ncbi:MAG TPA: hypothetical protein VK638_16775 [Edaphobacter sp.]|nr:hypothetical protein [Edaphobacter sp.]